MSITPDPKFAPMLYHDKPEKELPESGSDQRLVLRLQTAIAHMAPHQRECQNGALLIEATAEIMRLTNACNRWSESETLGNHPLMHCPKCGELRGHGHSCDEPQNARAMTPAKDQANDQ